MPIGAGSLIRPWCRSAPSFGTVTSRGHFTRRGVVCAATVADVTATTFQIAGRTVGRVGFGAMQLPGPGVFGPPKDHDEAIAVLRRAIDAGVNHIDTAQYYGPGVSNELIHEALTQKPTTAVIASRSARPRAACTSPHATTEQVSTADMPVRYRLEPKRRRPSFGRVVLFARDTARRSRQQAGAVRRRRYAPSTRRYRMRRAALLPGPFGHRSARVLYRVRARARAPVPGSR
jgi:Aldo/keto reductase family